MRFFYLRDEHKMPVACVASVGKVDGATAVVRYAVSTYNPKEGFRRERARRIAEDRLIVGKWTVLEIPATAIKKQIVQHIAGDATLPTRARKAAKFWLAPSIEL